MLWISSGLDVQGFCYGLLLDVPTKSYSWLKNAHLREMLDARDTMMRLHNKGRNADKISATDMQDILAGYAFSDQQNSPRKIIKK